MAQTLWRIIQQPLILKLESLKYLITRKIKTYTNLIQTNREKKLESSINVQNKKLHTNIKFLF